MAAVRSLCCWATPAVRSGYGEGKPPDQYRSACTFRSDHTAEHHVHHHDRCRRRWSYFCQDRPLVALVQQRYYQALPDRHHSSNIGHPTGSEHKRTPRPGGISSTEWRFSLPTSHAGISATAYFGIPWLPDALLS